MNKLKAVREQKNMTQSDLAKLANISVRTIQDYEQGRKKLNSAYTSASFKLAMALDTDVKNIIDYDVIREDFLNNLTNILVDIEMDTGSHEDYPDDYETELEFYLSNVERDDYLDYITSNYPVTKDEVEYLQESVKNLIESKFE